MEQMMVRPSITSYIFNIQQQDDDISNAVDDYNNENSNGGHHHHHHHHHHAHNTASSVATYSSCNSNHDHNSNNIFTATSLMLDDFQLLEDLQYGDGDGNDDDNDGDGDGDGDDGDGDDGDGDDDALHHHHHHHHHHHVTMIHDNITTSTATCTSNSHDSSSITSNNEARHQDPIFPVESSMKDLNNNNNGHVNVAYADHGSHTSLDDDGPHHNVPPHHRLCSPPQIENYNLDPIFSLSQSTKSSDDDTVATTSGFDHWLASFDEELNRTSQEYITDHILLYGPPSNIFHSNEDIDLVFNYGHHGHIINNYNVVDDHAGNGMAVINVEKAEDEGLEGVNCGKGINMDGAGCGSESNTILSIHNCNIGDHQRSDDDDDDDELMMEFQPHLAVVSSAGRPRSKRARRFSDRAASNWSSGTINYSILTSSTTSTTSHYGIHGVSDNIIDPSPNSFDSYTTTSNLPQNDDHIINIHEYSNNHHHQNTLVIKASSEPEIESIGPLQEKYHHNNNNNVSGIHVDNPALVLMYTENVIHDHTRTNYEEEEVITAGITPHNHHHKPPQNNAVIGSASGSGVPDALHLGKVLMKSSTMDHQAHHGGEPLANAIIVCNNNTRSWNAMAKCSKSKSKKGECIESVYTSTCFRKGEEQMNGQHHEDMDHGLSSSSSSSSSSSQICANGGNGRRCSHCLSQKTPQWRAGPDGPKTLCNACGVRYKSGRLFDEYRPAKSPTFSSYKHSNSHKKVMEMRRRKLIISSPCNTNTNSTFNNNNNNKRMSMIIE